MEGLGSASGKAAQKNESKADEGAEDQSREADFAGAIGAIVDDLGARMAVVGSGLQFNGRVVRDADTLHGRAQRDEGGQGARIEGDGIRKEKK